MYIYICIYIYMYIYIVTLKLSQSSKNKRCESLLKGCETKILQKTYKSTLIVFANLMGSQNFILHVSSFESYLKN